MMGWNIRRVITSKMIERCSGARVLLSHQPCLTRHRGEGARHLDLLDLASGELPVGEDASHGARRDLVQAPPPDVSPLDEDQARDARGCGGDDGDLAEGVHTRMSTSVTLTMFAPWPMS